MLKVLKFFSAAPVRFPHWKSHIRKGSKLSLNPKLNLKTKTPPKKTHDYIDFRTLTGNEILYNFQNVQHFRPFEYSNSFLNLGLKKGAPTDYEWESNPFVQTALKYGKTKLPQFNCKVLTSLAHAWNRLGVKDPEIWTALEKNILRQLPSIEPEGVARAMQAFAKRPAVDFWAKIDEMLPVYIRQFIPSDFVRAVEAYAGRKEEQNLDNYEKYIYPHIELKRYRCTPAMLERLQAALEGRPDFTEERRGLITEAIHQRYENLKRVKFGGLRVPHEQPKPKEEAAEEGKPEEKKLGEGKKPEEKEPKEAAPAQSEPKQA